MRLTRFLLILLFCKHLKTTDDADDAAGHKSFMCATIQTGFCDWSARYFAQPVMKVSPEFLATAEPWNVASATPLLAPEAGVLTLPSSCPGPWFWPWGLILVPKSPFLVTQNPI